VESDLVGSVSGEFDLDGAIAALAESQPDRYAPAPARRQVASVHFDNESSPDFTILDVVCWDRVGLLYSLCRAMSQMGVNIEFAKISTRLGLVQDVFYVNDSQSGQKITSPDRLSELRNALTEAAASSA